MIAAENEKPVSNRKTLYILLAVVVGLLFICLITIVVIVAFVIPKPRPLPSEESCKAAGLYYDIDLNKCVSSPLTSIVPTEPITITPTSTPIEDSQVRISKPVKIDFNGNPRAAESVSLFVDEYGYDDDNVQDTYEIGVFSSGEISNELTSQKMDLSGKKLYLAVIQEGVMFDLRGPWVTHVHFIIDNNKYYILDLISEYFDPGVKPEVNTTFSAIIFNEFVMPQGLYEAVGATDDDNILKSSKGVYYSDYIEFWPTLFHNSDMIAVDTLKGATVYMSKSDEYSRTFVKANNGFLYNVVAIPSILIKNEKHDYSYKAEISWINGGNNTSNYAYASIGSCLENELEVVKNPPALKKTGVASNGTDIYEASSDQESYQKGIYEEDYIKGEIYKYNVIANDDTTPLTYEQYLSYHPVFYWKDEYGRYVKFANENFVFSGGCGKPVVYLYPTETTKTSVKVIPNGRLTLTVPSIGKDNTWDVVATKDSQITDVATGKKYSYLWWESQGASNVIIPKEGFVIANNNLENDLRALLKSMNLSSVEINGFCDYWLPIMQEDNAAYYFVTFLFNEQVNQIAELEFSPKPDVVNRVFMVYEPLEQKIEAKPLEIMPLDRNGFYVVEWGGAKK